MFTGLRVGITTAKVLAQSLRIPVIPIPSLDLLAYPLRYAHTHVVATIDARRRELYWAIYRPVPGGVQRASEYELGEPDQLVAELEARGQDAIVCGDGVLRFPDTFAQLGGSLSIAGPAHASPSLGRARRACDCSLRTRGLLRACRRPSALPAPERCRDRVAEEGRVMAATRELVDRFDVQIAPMRRRHLRGVVRIEAQVYPRPWTQSLFVSELALRSTRAYYVAKLGREVVGYAGLMLSMSDGHITTIAVDPAWHRHSIGTRLLLTLAREAITRDATALTLEVRLSNRGAQELYRRFGFIPVGVRKGYYADTGEDALVMWAYEVSEPPYKRLLDRIERNVTEGS